MNSAYRPDWRTILFGLYILVGILTAGSGALAFGLLSLTDYLRGDSLTGFLGVWSGLTFVVVSAAGLPAGAVAFRALQSASAFEARRPAAMWLLAIGLFPIGLGLGYWIYEAGQAPPLLGTFAQILALGGPIIFAAVVVQRAGPAISAVRAWVHFLLGLWLIPFVAFFTELVLLVVAAIVVVLGLSLTPGGLGLLNQLLGPRPQGFSSPPPQAFTDLLTEPWFIVLLIVFLCILIPMVEELLKSAAIWPALPRSPSPSQAFMGGALGGLGFALVEAMFLTQPDMSWFTTALVRGGASMMHALAAGITSWGLAEAVVRRRRWRLPLAYAIAVGLHGTWNLSAIGIGFSQLRSQLNLSPLTASLQPWVAAAAGATLLMLSLGAFLALPLITRRLAASSATIDPTPAAAGSPSD